MSNRDDIRIALWQQDTQGSPGKPVFKGNIEYPDGTKKSVSLWPNKGKQGAPTYTGVVDDGKQ